jgi:predicted nucleotidyltransferase
MSKKIEDELVNGLLDIFGENISKIILYGSFARNEETDESDIDIAVINIYPISEDIRDAFIDWSSEMDLKYDRVFSIIDIEKERFEAWENVLPFYKNVSREGIVLWSAA